MAVFANISQTNGDMDSDMDRFDRYGQIEISIIVGLL